jgi:hypothetical protein
MNLADYLEKWGRSIFEAPVAGARRAEEPPELAEIRLAILDEIRAKSYRSGGKLVYPFDLVRVHVLGVEESRAPLFQGRFFRQYLEHEVRDALGRSDCRFPETLRAEVTITPHLPGPQEDWLTIESVTTEAAPASERGRARLVVLEGAANLPEIRLDKTRTNIGRTVDVYRDEGLFRRNDLAFAEDTEINRTVSREHAHILFEKTTGEYRLFNDRWYTRDGPHGGQSATWIVRDGMSQEVHRDARGTRLEPGDEIRLGRAVVRFEV